MARRLKVLISAYSCEPGKGSEPEVGWQWALQMARFHEVTVVTRANNRPVIEPALEQLRGQQPLPAFVYHDRSTILLDFKRRTKAIKLYYILWQRSVREVIERLHHLHQYDLLHHVTFAGFRFPTAIWGHGAATLWGPIGGIESLPHGMLPWFHPASMAHELARNANNLLQSTPFHVLPERARATTMILASTPEMRRTLGRLGFEVEVMPTIGLKTKELPYQPRRAAGGTLKLLFVGNIITLKGVDLALDALASSGSKATLTLFGTGNYLQAAKRQAHRLGLGDRVIFRGRLPRAEILRVYPDYDVFLFPSLHDTGGYAVIEAMLNELPVVCLDCGGPAVAVRVNCGLKVSLGKRARVVAELAAAIRWYDGNRWAITEHGQAARRAVLRHYDWDIKGEEMNARYQETVKRFRESRATGSKASNYSGMGGVTTLVHRVLSLHGLAVSLAVLFLIGALGFISTGHLKKQAAQIVNDTLPGLSYAGEANASLAQGFSRTLLFLMTESSEQQVELRREIDSFSAVTTTNLNAYRLQILEPEDNLQYEACLERRAEYVAVRERMFRLVESNQRSDAIAITKAELLPAYGRYKAAAEKLSEYNMRQGKSRGQTILTVCTITQFIVAGIGIFVFVVGFFIGLFR